jgi:hypothetical protein
LPDHDAAALFEAGKEAGLRHTGTRALSDPTPRQNLGERLEPHDQTPLA